MSDGRYTIAEDVGPDQELIPIVKRLRIDDEIMWIIHSWSVGAKGPYWTYSWRTKSATQHPAVEAHLSCRVLRGQEGTVRAPHADGAEIVWLD